MEYCAYVGTNLVIETYLLRCYISTVLVYGMETRTVMSLNRLEAFETWYYRRIQRISWVELPMWKNCAESVKNVESARRSKPKRTNTIMTITGCKIYENSIENSIIDYHWITPCYGEINQDSHKDRHYKKKKKKTMKICASFH